MIACKKTQKTPAKFDFLLTKWDTLPFKANFKGKILAGDADSAFYTPVGSMTIGGKTYDVGDDTLAAFSLLQFTDTTIVVSSAAFSDSSKTFFSDKAPRRIIFPMPALDVCAKWAETKTLGALWNVLPVREWLLRKQDTINSIEIINANIDKDADIEKMIRLKTLHTNSMMLTLDKQGADWILCNAMESFDEIDGMNPPFNSYFDAETRLWIAQTRDEYGSDGEDMASSYSDGDLRFSIRELGRYYHDGEWSESIFLWDKESSETNRFGRYAFVKEANSTLAWKSDITLVQKTVRKTTGGWLKTPFLETDSTFYNWNEKENKFTRLDSKQKQRKYWGKIPKETLTDTAKYWLNTPEKQPIFAINVYKIVEKENDLGVETLSEAYIFEGEKYEKNIAEEENGNNFQLWNRDGESQGIYIKNVALGKKLDNLYQKNLKTGVASDSFPRKWLAEMEKGIIPNDFLENAKQRLSLYDISSAEEDIKGAKPKIYTLSSGLKVVYLWKNDGEEDYILVINPKTQKIVSRNNNAQMAYPTLKNDRLFFDYTTKDGEHCIAYKELVEGNNSYNWSELFSENSNNTRYSRALQEKLDFKIVNESKPHIAMQYNYTWQTRDGKTIIFKAAPINIDWNYKTDENGIENFKLSLDGKELTYEEGDIRRIFFRANIKKLRELQKTGSSEQKKWLEMYLPFYCDKYGIKDNTKRIKGIIPDLAAILTPYME